MVLVESLAGAPCLLSDQACFVVEVSVENQLEQAEQCEAFSRML